MRIPVKVHVCFTPKADMCSAQAHVCFGPKADIARLFDPSFVSRRKKRRIEDIRHAWFCLEFVCQSNLVDRLLETPDIHAAVTVRSHFRRENVVSDGHAQSFELHLLFGFLIASENRFDRARGTHTETTTD